MTRTGIRGAPAMALAAGAGLLAATIEPAQATPFAVDTGGTAVEALSFSQFDPTLGTLTGVKFTLADSSTGETSTLSITGGEGSGTATMSAGFEIKGPGQGGPLSLLLFSGTGSATSDCTSFGSCTSSGNDTTVAPTFTNPAFVNTPIDFAPYVGLGTFSVDVDLTGPTLGDTCTPFAGFSLVCTPGGGATWSGDLTVAFTTTVPEPSSLGLLAVGLAGLTGILRRRRAQR